MNAGYPAHVLVVFLLGPVPLAFYQRTRKGHCTKKCKAGRAIHFESSLVVPPRCGLSVAIPQAVSASLYSRRLKPDWLRLQCYVLTTFPQQYY